MPILSHDALCEISQKFWMKDASGTDYKQAFLRRTKEAREAARYTQEQIAKVLQITQDTYKQYETRSLLPHRLIGPFCAATRVSEAWLLTGSTAASPSRKVTEARTA